MKLKNNQAWKCIPTNMTSNDHKWSKKDSVRFALYCLKRSMKRLDKTKFPEVWKVCLGSVKVINAVLLRDTKKNRELAWSAWSAAWSAERQLQEKWIQKHLKQRGKK